MGDPYDETQENACDADNIANLDSLFVDPQGNLRIGEDTATYVNNTIWGFATLPGRRRVRETGLVACRTTPQLNE